MKCALKLAILLVIATLPLLAQQPQQRIPPWLRQQQQQPANTAQPPAPTQTAPTTAPAQTQPQVQQVQPPPVQPAPARTARPTNQQPTYPRPASVSPATNVTRPATTTPTVPTARTGPATVTAGATTNQAVTKKGKKSAKAEKKEEPEPLPPAAPVAQMTPADLPPSPPQVSYLNGQLLVLSQNATLGDVLNAIRTRTGAQIDYPAAAAQERVAIRLGPAPARDVLAQLLNGSRFDYMILGNPQQPGSVQKVILTPKQGGAPNEMAQSAIQRAPAPAPPVQEDVNPDEDQNDVSTVQPEQEPQVAQPSPQGIQPPGVAQPLQQPQANQQPLQNQPFQQPPFQQPFGQQPQVQPGANVQQPGQVKTPEQLLRELQQMQQQQQQQQQQQGQNPPPQ